MSEIIRKEGFNFGFNPKACEECGGKCCTGESGYIWVTPIEMQKIANFLNIPLEEFKQKFLIKVGYKFSIKEKLLSKNNYACLFFDEKTNRCTIYDVRPNQCRTFPFWDFFKRNVNEVKKECPGIID
jgi:Fe-S-cluster containining protein